MRTNLTFMMQILLLALSGSLYLLRSSTASSVVQYV